MTVHGAAMLGVRATVLGAVALLVTAPASWVGVTALAAGDTPASGFEVSFLPPGLLLRGEAVTLSVFADSSTSGEIDPSGDVFVRGGGQTGFTRVHLGGSKGLVANVPSTALSGSTLDSYAVVRDGISGTSITVPAAGADGPFRSWILDGPTTVALGTHRFGDVRSPDAIVVDAQVGEGAGEVGIECPPDGPCDAPQSFDVAPDGTVWVADVHNSRLDSWTPGESVSPGRAIDLDFAPADVAVAPDGRIYVWGAKGGVGMRLYALSPEGDQLWEAETVSVIFNDHIRFEPDGFLYLRASQFGWVPVVGSDGQPLSVADQREGAARDQPVSGDQRLVVGAGCPLDPGCDNPFDARVGLVSGGSVQEAWHLTSGTVLVDEPTTAVPALVDGDPVVLSAVYDFQRHLEEFEVIRLSPGGGTADRFSLSEGIHGDEPVTGIRLGPDGALYQMLYDVTHPESGMQIARYELAGGATPTPTETATVTQTPTTSEPIATTAPSATGSPPTGGGGGWSGAEWLAASLGGLALAGGLAALLWFRRRSRMQGPPALGPGGPGPTAPEDAAPG